jgi:L-threonylcarbamoyladenylate synthase
MIIDATRQPIDWEPVLAALRAGELVAIPTETVYGLAADAANGRAIARIFEVKGRPRFNPLICHVDGLAMAERLAVFNKRARQLAKAFWPGPLTLVLPRRADAPVHPLVSAGLPTIAVRAPQGVSRELIGRFGGPLAAPSANISGRLSPTRAEHVLADLGDQVAHIVDGGPCRVGLESTIVALGDGPPRLLRPGAVPAEAVERVLGEELARPQHGGPVAAPGMLASHYAPRAALRLDVREVQASEALLAFGPDLPSGAEKAVAIRNLSPSGDLAEAAANLFAHLAELDLNGAGRIAVAPIPCHGLGEAINDRLRRAAAPRPAGHGIDAAWAERPQGRG